MVDTWWPLLVAACWLACGCYCCCRWWLLAATAAADCCCFCVLVACTAACWEFTRCRGARTTTTPHMRASCRRVPGVHCGPPYHGRCERTRSGVCLVGLPCLCASSCMCGLREVPPIVLRAHVVPLRVCGVGARNRYPFLVPPASAPRCYLSGGTRCAWAGAGPTADRHPNCQQDIAAVPR